jgi:hypothetical protein
VTVEAAPQSRRMDLSRVADVMLFGQPGDGAGEFYLSHLWLELLTHPALSR